MNEHLKNEHLKIELLKRVVLPANVNYRVISNFFLWMLLNGIEVTAGESVLMVSDAQRDPDAAKESQIGNRLNVGDIVSFPEIFSYAFMQEDGYDKQAVKTLRFSQAGIRYRVIKVDYDHYWFERVKQDKNFKDNVQFSLPKYLVHADGSPINWRELVDAPEE